MCGQTFLREKIAVMVTPAGVAAWADALSRFWMEADPHLAGILYVALRVEISGSSGDFGEECVGCGAEPCSNSETARRSRK